MGRGTGTDGSFDGSPNELPEHVVNVAPYSLDRFEVTVGRFRNFLLQYPGSLPLGLGAIPGVPGSGWTAEMNGMLPSSASQYLGFLKCGLPQQTWTDSPGANENKPVNCLRWVDYAAFCAWDGGRLPTEAEWEFAAAGGTSNRLYPWGSTPPDPSYAVFDEDMFVGPIKPVGSAPNGLGKFGHADLAGNVFEFVFDQYDANAYANPTCNTTAGCVVWNQPGLTEKVIRGGGYLNGASFLRSAARFGFPDGTTASVGARCAR